MPVRVEILLGEVIVRTGERLTDEDIEKIDALGLGPARPDVASLFGWFLLAVLIVGMMFGWMWRFRPKLWHRDNALVLTGLLRRRGHDRAAADGRPLDPPVLPADGGDRDAHRDPARRVARDRRHRARGDHRRGRERRLPRVRDLRLPGRDGRHRRDPSGRSVPGVRPGGGDGVRRQCRGRDDLLAPRCARRPGRARAVVRFGDRRRRFGYRRGRDVRGPRLGLRHPDGLPVARAGQPVTAAAPAPAGRDAGHVPPLPDGGQPRGARRGGGRGRSAGHARRGLLPRHRQAREPDRLHREPGRWREHP